MIFYSCLEDSSASTSVQTSDETSLMNSFRVSMIIMACSQKERKGNRKIKKMEVIKRGKLKVREIQYRGREKGEKKKMEGKETHKLLK